MTLNRFSYPQRSAAPLIAILLFCFLAFISCEKRQKRTNNKIPSIKYISISGDSIQAGSNTMINVAFNFSDDDGDLGRPNPGNYDIYTIDSRDSAKNNYFFPQGIEQGFDIESGLSGECVLGLEGAFMLLRPDHPTRDTVRYEIYIRDRAGNESNRITTPDIILTL